MTRTSASLTPVQANDAAATVDRHATRAHDRSDLVILSNRLPLQRTNESGGSKWKTSPGGLVSALTPVLREVECTWVGWLGNSRRPTLPFDHDGVRHHPVELSREEIERHYEGFSNRTLWPLYHDAIRPPEFHRRWWRPYVEINRRFAREAADTVVESGLVWVQDYHLQLVPEMLRAMRPDVRIGFFLHIPFPPAELFSQLPWRRRILEGLLGADIVGFQTPNGAANFSQVCRRYTEATGTRQQLKYRGRCVNVGAFPISIDFDLFATRAREPRIVKRAENFRKRLGDQRKIVLGVDRLDYTKGIDRRLQAYRELLGSGRRSQDEVVFVQVAVPSRERVEDYQELRSRVEQFVGEINGEFGVLGRTPVHYLHKSLNQDELIALYSAADVMVVTPFRDGMNLVAKEYVATRSDGLGVLVLSEFTGSANELKSALLVNPHDTDELAATIGDALDMSEAEQKKRMRSLRKTVRDHDVYKWAQRFLDALREHPGRS